MSGAEPSRVTLLRTLPSCSQKPRQGLDVRQLPGCAEPRPGAWAGDGRGCAWSTRQGSRSLGGTPLSILSPELYVSRGTEGVPINLHQRRPRPRVPRGQPGSTCPRLPGASGVAAASLVPLPLFCGPINPQTLGSGGPASLAPVDVRSEPAPLWPEPSRPPRWARGPCPPPAVCGQHRVPSAGPGHATQIRLGKGGFRLP